MKTEPKFWTIQQFMTSRGHDRELHHTAIVLLVALCAGCGVFYLSILLAPKPAAQITIEGSRARISTDVRGNESLWDHWAQAARLAGQRWDAAGIEVPTIKMIASQEACSPDALACADVGRKIIYVAKYAADVDRTTVMMHEIGHVLGVSHIEGDPLMDKNYQNSPLEKPSDAAIAVARSLLPQVGQVLTVLPSGTATWRKP